MCCFGVMCFGFELLLLDRFLVVAIGCCVWWCLYFLLWCCLCCARGCFAVIGLVDFKFSGFTGFLVFVCGFRFVCYGIGF